MVEVLESMSSGGERSTGARQNMLPATCRHDTAAARPLTDTDRINALFTLFGGAYAFEPFFRVQEHFRHGRLGLDKFILDNPSLLEKPDYSISK